MKRISTISLKRILCLTAIAVVGIAPQAANAYTVTLNNGSYVQITTTCNAMSGIWVSALSSTHYTSYFKLWARYEYRNGAQTEFELVKDWTPIAGYQQQYAPVQNTNSRYVQLYISIATWNGSQWQYTSDYSNFSVSYYDTSQWWCWT